jgi:hypothetical protein
MIKKQRDAGFTGVVVMYSWIGRWIEPLQKWIRFSFEYLGVLDSSWFFAKPIQRSDAIVRVSRVLMGDETVPFVPKMYSAKEPPKHECICILLFCNPVEAYLQ